MESNQHSPIQNKQRGSFFAFTTTRPVAILMVVIGVVVFGFISYKQLPLNLMPDISYPSLTVRTEYPGTAPEEVETTISRPIEQALGIVDNLVSISSISKAGQSDVKLEFTWDTDMNEATSDVREKLDQVYFAEDVERPILLRYDPTLDPIIRLGLYGDASLFYMRYMADEELKRILETIDGVAAVKVKGGFEEEIRVELDEQKLTLIGINIQQIRNRLAQENVNLAGGNLKEGQTEYLVRTLNEFKSVDEIAEVVIGNWNGREIKIKDVGQVSRTNKEREIITHIDGHESVEIEIFKEADANIVDVARRVRNLVLGAPEQQTFVRNLEAEKARQEAAANDSTKNTAAKTQEKKQGKRNKPGPGDDLKTRMMTSYLANNLPEGVHIELLSDQSVFIENAVNEVKSTAVVGGILAIIVLFIFLRNMTATLIVGVSIPISIIATFAPMKMFDVSLNIMSLGGLALGIGMLVDNSIVVLESIARCREEGESLVQATIRGVSEVGGAVFASTLTTVAVFFPIVFVEGVAGQIFGNMALTVVFSLLASLAVALFLIPMLSSRESSKFVDGMQSSQLLQKHIFQFSTEPKITALLEKGHSATFGEKIVTGMMLLIQTIGIALFKAIVGIVAFILALIKLILLIICLPFMLLLSIARWLHVYKFNFTDKVIEFAENPDWGAIRFAKNIWASFLVYQAVPNLARAMRSYMQKFYEKSLLVKIGLGALLLLYFVVQMIKLVFHSVLELFFRVIHTIFTLLGIVIKAVAIIAKLLFAAPLNLMIWMFNALYNKLESYYPRVLQQALDKRMAVIGTTTIVFLLTLFNILPRIGSELIPEVHQGEFNVDVTLPVGTPVERTESRISDFEQFLINQPGVDKVAAVIGTDKTSSTESEEGEHTAKMTVTLKRASSVIVQEENVIKAIRSEMTEYPGIQSKISRPVLFSFKTPVEVEIHGYSLENLKNVTREVEEKMLEIPGMFDVKSNIQSGNPEVQIIYNRQLLARYGLNIMEVASIVRNKVRGDVATEFKERDRKIDVLVRLNDSDKESIDNLRRLIINPNGERPLPLEAVADIRVNEGPSEIRRVDQQRTAVISANISGRDLRSVSEDIYQLLRTTDMPADFTYTLAGQNKEMETSLGSLKLALALAIFLVYIVMASQFESLIHPFVIIFTIPLALIGVFLFLWALHIPMSIVVFLGMIMLAGIVVNNAIVLVDYINHLRDRGMEKMQAIVEAGKIRLRPILMTTLTTVLGLLPMAIGLGDGAEIRKPMAITVIVGLITSTILTLVVIPTVYSLVDRRK